MRWFWMRWFGWFRRKPEPQQQWVEGSTGTPVMQTDGGKLFKIVGLDDTCPDCGGEGFYGGPSGGMSRNVFCRNVKCRSGFNLTPFGSGQGTCERIHRGYLKSYPTEAFGDNLTITQRMDAQAAIEQAESRSGPRKELG